MFPRHSQPFSSIPAWQPMWAPHAQVRITIAIGTLHRRRSRLVNEMEIVEMQKPSQFRSCFSRSKSASDFRIKQYMKQGLYIRRASNYSHDSWLMKWATAGFCINLYDNLNLNSAITAICSLCLGGQRNRRYCPPDPEWAELSCHSTRNAAQWYPRETTRHIRSVWYYVEVVNLIDVQPLGYLSYQVCIAKK